MHAHDDRGERGRRWALVLAAGEGTRLAHLTRGRDGVATPKQFCSVAGGPTLLEETLTRAATIVGRRQVMTIVAAAHRRWWESDLASVPQDNVVVQPMNRGTAAGILLPLLTLAERDPEATVVVLPSDHWVDDETALCRAMRGALDEVERDPSSLVLLGISPDTPDPELGWIVPAMHADACAPVSRFVEKPSIGVATELMRRGALWNSFIFAGRVATLVGLCRSALPALSRELTWARGWDAIHPSSSGALWHVYRNLSPRDFSREVLSRRPHALRVLRVPACGWSDLGTPERLRLCAGGHLPATPVPPEVAAGRPALALVAASMP